MSAALLVLILGAGVFGSTAPAGSAGESTPDTGRMLATIRHFSEDEAGQPISRFAYRIEMNALEDAVSYTHLTLPTNREV